MQYIIIRENAQILIRKIEANYQIGNQTVAFHTLGLARCLYICVVYGRTYLPYGAFVLVVMGVFGRQIVPDALGKGGIKALPKLRVLGVKGVVKVYISI